MLFCYPSQYDAKTDLEFGKTGVSQISLIHQITQAEDRRDIFNTCLAFFWGGMIFDKYKQ